MSVIVLTRPQALRVLQNQTFCVRRLTNEQTMPKEDRWNYCPRQQRLPILKCLANP
jgi:hypothetical protein